MTEFGNIVSEEQKNELEMENTKKIEYEIWNTSCKIDWIDKEYKYQDPKTIRKGIIYGAKALGYSAVLALSNQFGLSTLGINIIGTIDIVLHTLLSSLILGSRATYKFRKKRLENKLEQLEEKRLNSKGIFTIDDYEVVLEADTEEIDKEIFKQKTTDTNNVSLLEDGGNKHVR